MFLCLNFPGSLGTFNKLYHFDLTPVLVNLQLTSDETLIHQKTFSRATQSFIFCSSRQKYYFFCSKNPIFAYISCGLCCSSWCTNPSLIWGWSSSSFLVNNTLKLNYSRSCRASPASK